MKILWLSSHKMTFRATVDNRGIVVEAAPIARVFVGQPLENLIGWMKQQGGFASAVLSVEQGPE